MAQERVIADVADAFPGFTRGTKIAATAASRVNTLPARTRDSFPVSPFW